MPKPSRTYVGRLRLERPFKIVSNQAIGSEAFEHRTRNACGPGAPPCGAVQGDKKMRNHRTEARVRAWPNGDSQSSRSSIQLAKPVAVALPNQKPLMGHVVGILLLFGIGLGIAGTLAWIAVTAWILFWLVLEAARSIL